MFFKRTFVLIELILYIFFFAVIWFYIAFSSFSILKTVETNYNIYKFSSEYSLFIQKITDWALQGWDYYTGTKYDLVFVKWDLKRDIFCSWWTLGLSDVYSWDVYNFTSYDIYQFIKCDSLSWWQTKWWYWIKLDLFVWDKLISLPYYFYNWFRM